jgi:O-antigen ligase
MGRGKRVWLLERWTDVDLDAPLQGYGLGTSGGTTFSKSNIGPYLGPHNMFLAVWADDGFVMLVAFVIVLAAGVLQQWKVLLDNKDRLLVALIWVTWILTISKGHDAFDSDVWAFFWAVLVVLPTALDLHQNRHIAGLQPLALGKR